MPSKEDKIPLLPGQHPGIFVGLGIPDTGEIIKIHAYGGLRGLCGEDLHDNDRTFRRTGTGRTDDLASQTTFLGAHMVIPKGDTVFNIWIAYTPYSKLSLNSIKYNEVRIDAHPSILPNHNNFKQLTAGLYTNVGSLLKLIPW